MTRVLRHVADAEGIAVGGMMDVLIANSNGDLRSAINSLQFVQAVPLSDGAVSTAAEAYHAQRHGTATASKRRRLDVDAADAANRFGRPAQPRG